MALSADRRTEYKEGVDRVYPVAANAVIYAGAMVCLDANGYAVPAADTANYKFAGVARGAVDNTGGSNGDKDIVVRWPGVFRFKASSITQAMVGKIMYVVDDETFDDSAGNNGIVCGRLVEYVSATEGWLDTAVAIYAGASMAAGNVSLSDAGDHFAAAEHDAESALQKLSKALPPLLVPRFTGWTKDGTDQDIATPALEFPVPVRIKRAYAVVGTAPGTDKTLTLKLGSDTLLSISGTDTKGEAEDLDIAVAADTDIAIKVNETSGGSGANCDLYLVVALDDGE